MKMNLDAGWRSILKEEFDKPYFKGLSTFVEAEYRDHTCFPTAENIFAAFNDCAFEDVKVVILGQDPYHGENQAHGLCFSVQEGVKIPPSLVNIFKEIHTDLGLPIPDNGKLERWAKQGVLLLNDTLTVRAHEAGSHQRKGWEKFTDAVIAKLSEERQNIVFLLWGGFAKKKGKTIDTDKHLVLTSGHPSPLSANRGYWFGNKHFSQTNQFLKKIGKKTINW